MITPTLRSLRSDENEYCRQPITSESYPLLDVVGKVQHILNKTILCRHDVEAINHFYRDLGSKDKFLSGEEKPQKAILEAVTDKVNNITKVLSAGNLITIYNLQEFLEKNLNVQQMFQEAKKKFQKDSRFFENDDQGDGLNEVAKYLPICSSMDQFEEDYKHICGDAVLSEYTNHIVDLKKKRILRREKLEKAVKTKQQEVLTLKQKNPHLYPPYLDDLLASGFFYLCDHLVDMRGFATRNDRRNAIEKMTFSQAAHVILEVREALIERVGSSLPTDKKNILFLLGGTGSGKTTTFCFLRGDEMILEDFNYRSKNDQDNLIGHNNTLSCTFLPKVEVVKDVVLVDFPGFEDTHGPLVSLGIEFALKALINRYNPKILILESITNTEGKYASAAKLGAYLTRLLSNKENCILGITKYTKDPDYGRLQSLEEIQLKELAVPSEEESEIKGEIKVLKRQNRPENQKELEELEKKLLHLEEKRKQINATSLPDTCQKQEHRKRIEEREEALLHQIGLKQKIRLGELNPLNRSACLEKFGKLKTDSSLGLQSEQELNADDKKLLEFLFENNLKLEISKQQQENIENLEIKEFEARVIETSLIHTLFSKTSPEIGELLHLPEMDPQIVRAFDQQVVADCMKEYRTSVISTLNIAFFRKVLDQIPANSIARNKREELNQKLKRLRNYILGLLGSLPEDDTRADAEWERIQFEYKKLAKDLDKRFAMPMWAKVLLSIPLGVPLGIRSLYEWKITQNETEKFYTEKVDNLCIELDVMYDALLRLNSIQKVIEKLDLINQAFLSVNLSLESRDALIRSIQMKINKVRETYGSKDWDRRVEYYQTKIEKMNAGRIKLRKDDSFFMLCLFMSPYSNNRIHIEMQKGKEKCLLYIDHKASELKFAFNFNLFLILEGAINIYSNTRVQPRSTFASHSILMTVLISAVLLSNKNKL